MTEENILPKALEKLIDYGISEKQAYVGSMDAVVTPLLKEYSIASGKDGKTVVNTFGLEDCVAVTLYDAKNSVAAVAHFGEGTNVEASFYAMLEDLNKAGGASYEARLFGGNQDSITQLLEIVGALQSHAIPIVEADILEGTQTRDIGISTSGELYNNMFRDNDPNFMPRMIAAQERVNEPLVYFKG